MYVRGKQLKILIYMGITTAENKEMMQIHTHLLKSLSASKFFFLPQRYLCNANSDPCRLFIFPTPGRFQTSFLNHLLINQTIYTTNIFEAFE